MDDEGSQTKLAEPWPMFNLRFSSNRPTGSHGRPKAVRREVARLYTIIASASSASSQRMRRLLHERGATRLVETRANAVRRRPVVSKR